MPDGSAAVHLSRCPSRTALVLAIPDGSVVQHFSSLKDRHFYGHGVFSADGHLLYATENDFQAERGIIGIYDATQNYARLGEFLSCGIGPHEIGLHPDGKTLVVANGSVATRPDLPRVKLNLPSMEPSLCYIDRQDGSLLMKLSLDPVLHKLSIRHLAINANATVAIGMQYEGVAEDMMPLIALHRGNGILEPIWEPADVIGSMKHYCGSICFDVSESSFAVSAPRGNTISFWETRTGRYLSSVGLRDACGIAAGARQNEFLASAGSGDLIVIDANSWFSRLLALREPSIANGTTI